MSRGGPCGPPGRFDEDRFDDEAGIAAAAPPPEPLLFPPPPPLPPGAAPAFAPDPLGPELHVHHLGLYPQAAHRLSVPQFCEFCCVYPRPAADPPPPPREPPPDPPELLSATLSIRPSISCSPFASMARLAVASGIVTNPNPRELPVSLSVGMWHSRTESQP